MGHRKGEKIMKIPAEFEDIFRGVELTEREALFLSWITSWDDYTVQNMRTVVEKVRSALSTLQAENASLRKERDAAVEDVLDAAITPCSYCKHGPINGGICDMDNDNHEMFSCWEWRGPEEG